MTDQASGGPQAQDPPAAQNPPALDPAAQAMIDSLVSGNMARINRDLQRQLNKDLPQIVQQTVQQAIRSTQGPGTSRPGFGERQRTSAPRPNGSDEVADPYGPLDGADEQEPMPRWARQMMRSVSSIEDRERKREEETTAAADIREYGQRVQTRLRGFGERFGVRLYDDPDLFQRYRTRLANAGATDATREAWDLALDVGLEVIEEEASRRVGGSQRQANDAVSQRAREAEEARRQAQQVTDRATGVNRVPLTPPSNGPTSKLDEMRRRVIDNARKGQRTPEVSELVRKAVMQRGLSREELR